MSGYSIGLCKLMQIDENQQKKETLIDGRKEMLDKKGNGGKGSWKDNKDDKYLSYGEFDRIGFEKISQFSRFRDLSENMRAWIGDKQVHLVYSICEDQYPDAVYFSNGKFYEMNDKEAAESDRLFIGLTVLQFKNNQKENRTDMERFLCGCKKGILKLVEEEKLDVKCAVLETLGSFGLTIIWLADQYVDVLKMVTKIKNADFRDSDLKNADLSNGDRKEKHMFLSAYTIFAQNCGNEDGWEKKVANIKGNAVLRLTLKNGVVDEVTDRLRDWKEAGASVYHCAGEHDVIIRMKSSEAFMAFDRGHDLHYNSRFFKKYVLQSNVQFCEVLAEPEYAGKDTVAVQSGEDAVTVQPGLDTAAAQSGVDAVAIQSGTDAAARRAGKDTAGHEQPKDNDSSGNPSLLESGKIRHKYMDLRENFIEFFPSTVGMVDTLDMLYSDYIAKISTESNEMWAEDFSHQFLMVLLCLEKYVAKFKELLMPREDILKMIAELLGDFEWQISHIAQSNNLTFGTPVCQFRYSGQNNLTLYAYFGIIKKVLNFVYHTQVISMQDEIVPLIVADIVPVIHSSLYDYEYGSGAGLGDNSKIVTIHLPMVSLYNPVCYYPYLYHEIFHYVVPDDRYRRNRVFGYLISTEILYSAFTYMIWKGLEEVVSAGECLDDFGKRFLLKYIYSSVIGIYEGYIGTSEKPDSGALTYLGIGQKALAAGGFEKNMLLKWVEWLRAKKTTELADNPIYLCICYLYGQRKAMIDDVSKWEESNPDREGVGPVGNRIREFLDELGGVANNEEPVGASEKYEELMRIPNEEVLNDAMMLKDGLKEAMADIAMVRLGNMDFAEYLLLFTKTKEDLLLECTDGDPGQDIIRVGMVQDFLHADSDSSVMETLNRAREKYINMYCALYYRSHKEHEEGYWDNFFAKANEWFEYWKECSIRYCVRYRMYSAVLRELQNRHLVSAERESGLQEHMGDDCRYWKEYAGILQDFGDYIRRNRKGNAGHWAEEKSRVDKRIFDLNIRLISNYQIHESFVALDYVRKERIKGLRAKQYDEKIPNFKEYGLPCAMQAAFRTGIQNYYWKYYTDNVGQLSKFSADIVHQLRRSNERILGDDEAPVWYRGHQSAEYQLIPSIMRKFKDEKAKQKDPSEFSLSGFLRKKFEEFRFRADGAQEAVERVGYTDSDYIALMQHYSVASNFLDWTEDALSALYFAMEGFLDKKVAKTNTNAALYIFSPELYNYARIKMISRQGRQDHQQDIEKEVVNRTMLRGIPNLTVSYNEENYFMYLLGLDKYKRENVTPFDTEALMLKKRIFYLPVAVYVSRLNKRIQAQNGMFLAYNIYTSPEDADTFDYIALERIQEDYLEKYKGEEDTCPFLYKIEIAQTAREKVASWVKAFGMSKEKCYPELVNIGERVMR